MKKTGTATLIPTTGELQLKKTGIIIHVLFDGAARPAIKETTLRSGSQRVVVLRLEANDALKYSFVIK